MRLRLTIAYDGAGLRGWQSQAGGETVQDYLEAAFARICGERVPVHGAGRTDAGVHALAQCAHVEVSRDGAARLGGGAERQPAPADPRAALPPAASQIFTRGFRPREKSTSIESGTGRSCRLLKTGAPGICRRPWRRSSCKQRRALSWGTHDFRNFAANRGKPNEDTVRTIQELTIRRKGALITLRVRGRDFSTAWSGS